MSEAIINFFTPTLGEELLVETIKSVQNQTVPNFKHTLVTDTPQANIIVKKVLEYYKPKNTLHYHLQERVTKGRPEPLISGFIHLINYDYFQVLGTGDWLEPNHCEVVLKTFEDTNADWVFSLRRIWDPEKKLICKDTFESIGLHPVWNSDEIKKTSGQHYYFVDGQSFICPKDKLLWIAPLWHLSRLLKQRTDKVLFDNLSSKYPNFKCTKQYTLNFRLGRGTKEQLEHAKQWYLKGKEYMDKKYPKGNFPWLI